MSTDGPTNKRPPQLLRFGREHPWRSCHRGGTFESDYKAMGIGMQYGANRGPLTRWGHVQRTLRILMEARRGLMKILP